jgi:DNA-binding response OmpR family regulator
MPPSTSRIFPVRWAEAGEAFALGDLRARLRALLRRSGGGANLLRFAGIELDLAPTRHVAAVNGCR